MFEGDGQINMNGKLGNEIYNICKKEEYCNIFEVGTWNGQGSTICVMNAIINKPNSILYSIESDINQFRKAVDFWENKPIKNKLILISGTLHTNIANEKDVKNACNGIIPCYHEHYLFEKNFLIEDSVVNIDKIQNIDIIILDGGEYTTEGDFNILINKNPKVIILDDASVYKCKNIREQLLNDVNWVLYKEDLGDRHGWSIFFHK